jgi:hypothetical protein
LNKHNKNKYIVDIKDKKDKLLNKLEYSKSVKINNNNIKRIKNNNTCNYNCIKR